jgi:DNA polymerase-3 subunit chi
MEVNFYQAAEGNLIPLIIRLLEKVFASGMRCIFHSPLEERIRVIDKTLWTFSTNSFIPHGDGSLGFCDRQPMYLTSGIENPNGASILMLVDTFEHKKLNNFKKALLIFEEEERVTEAKRLCEALKNNGENVNYWEQIQKGWKKQA